MHIYMNFTHIYYSQKGKKQGTKCKRDTELKHSNLGLTGGAYTLEQPGSSVGVPA